MKKYNFPTDTTSYNAFADSLAKGFECKAKIYEPDNRPKAGDQITLNEIYAGTNDPAFLQLPEKEQERLIKANGNKYLYTGRTIKAKISQVTSSLDSKVDLITFVAL